MATEITTASSAPDDDDIVTKGLSPAPYMGASIFMEGYGSKGAKPHPFNYHLAARQFHHLAYGLAMMNANAAAGVPLRLFARRRAKKGERKLYETRAASEPACRYLSGRGDLKPSLAVQAKVASWGYEVEEVVEPHPALSVLASPNPNDNGYEMSVSRFLDLQFFGNSWWYVVESRVGVPQMLFRMPGQWVHVVPNTSKTGANRVSGYVYGKNTANEVSFSEQEVDQFRMASVLDAGLFYGKGWVEAAWGKLGLANSKLVEDTAYKDNMSRPDWLLSIEGNKESIERAESKVNEKFRGAGNAGKFLVAGGKVTATALQFELKELGTPTRVIDETAFIAGVPVSIILTNDSNRGGSEGARMMWYRTTIHNYCIGDEEKLNQRYLPRFKGSEDYLLCYDHVSFEDRAELVKENVALVAGGIRSPNEARQYLGDPEAEGADYLYPPSGNTGGSAAVMGNLSPQQNDEQGQPKNHRKTKSVARMPKADAAGAREESEVQFKRDVFMAFLKDGTVNDVLANMTKLDVLMDDVGITREETYKDGPWLPVVSTSGPVVNGDVLKDRENDIVGGGPGQPPPEQITITRDASAGDKPPAESIPSGAADGVSNGDGAKDNQDKPAKDNAGA